MNDFTKDELNMMADGIVFIKNKCKVTDETLQRLHKIDQKLCSMINNYCEHKTNVWPLYTKDGCLPSGGVCYDCNKCIDKDLSDE